MSSYLSNLLTTTTSRYNSLRRTLLSSEDDGDTEDDTHICRVLRAYYSEKGRPFPSWLPADPNDKRAASAAPYPSQGGKSPYAGVQTQLAQRGSLNDLWDPPSAPQNTGPMQPQSLRNARRPMNNAPPPGSATLAPPQARPLPSQRAGSYQSVSSQQGRVEPSPPSSSGGLVAGTAQERLKARLWGGKGGSPSPSPAPSSVGAPNPFDQPQSGRNPAGGSGRQYGR
jgi:hypothetical protein